LAASYDVFLADDRIINMLPKTLGKLFMNTNKRPLPLRLAQKGTVSGDLGARIRRSVESAYLSISGGSNYTMRAARWNWKNESHIVDNVMDCISAGVQKCAGKWKNIQALHIKTGQSVALPIYTSLPEEEEEKSEKPKEAKGEKPKEAKGATKATDKAKDSNKASKKRPRGAKDENDQGPSAGKDNESKQESTPKKQKKSDVKAATTTKKGKKTEATSAKPSSKSVRKTKR
jgi:ribosome biogenesis protein UTP30